MYFVVTCPDLSIYCPTSTTFISYYSNKCTGFTDGSTTKRDQVNAPTSSTPRTCTPCAANYFATDNNNCVAHATPSCGTQVGAALRLVDGTPTTDAYCAECSDNTYAGTDSDNCLANTICGDQVAVGNNAAVNRLTDASRTVAGTCAACTASTYAGTDGADCLMNTLCGNLAAAGGSRNVGDASTTVAGSCQSCADGSFGVDDAADCVLATACAGTTDGKYKRQKRKKMRVHRLYMESTCSFDIFVFLLPLF